MADAGATYENEKERGRRPNPKDEDHRRDPSPDRGHVGEDRGRKARDSGADHNREFSPKETNQTGGYQKQHKGENLRYDQGGGGYYPHRNYNQYGGGNYQNRDGQQSGRGNPYYQRDNSHPGGQRGRGYYQQGQNWNERQGNREGRQHSEWQGNRGGQRGHYNERNQRDYNTEGRQESYGYGGRKRDEDPVVFLSKKLSFILRHGAEKMGFKLMPGGFLWVNDILSRNEYQDFTLEHIKHVVKTNDKQRFSLVQDENGDYKIRANQGHSIEVDGLELTPITDAKDAPEVIHGTYFSSWNIIKEQGLSKMGRNHIHFAAGEPGENGVISGMRSSCDVIIKLNMEKALNSGIKFFRSANNVILSPGDKDGFIRPCFFDLALSRYPRSKLPFNKEIQEGPSIPGLPKEMMGKTKKGKKKNKKSQGGKQNPNETKNVDREQEDNMEECTSMFDSEDVQETDEETKYESSQGPDSENLEVKAETDKSENAMPSSAPQEVPETWEDETDTKESENVQSSSKPKEFTSVTDEDCCISAVESLREEPVFVYCHLDGGEITSVSCVSGTGAYNFSKELLKEGGALKKLLCDCGDPIKIYYSIAETSKVLFDQYSIILDGTNVFDNRVALDYVKDLGEGNLNKLPSEFDAKPWGTMKVGAELLQKCLVSLEAFSLLSVWAGKKFKKFLFDEVNKEIDPEKLKEEKEKRKQAKKKPAAINVQQNSPKNQGKNKKSKKRN